jgi:hypothetical protein
MRDNKTNDGKKKVRRVVRRLMDAVEKTLVASDEVRRAKAELDRLAKTSKEDASCE